MADLKYVFACVCVRGGGEMKEEFSKVVLNDSIKSGSDLKGSTL